MKRCRTLIRPRSGMMCTALTLLLGEKVRRPLLGDEVADANDRTAFVASFKSKHQLMAVGRDIK